MYQREPIDMQDTHPGVLCWLFSLSQDDACERGNYSSDSFTTNWSYLVVMPPFLTFTTPPAVVLGLAVSGL